MSFMVYLYSTFGLYGCFDLLLGILTPYRSPSVGGEFHQSNIDYLSYW